MDFISEPRIGQRSPDSHGTSESDQLPHDSSSQRDRQRLACHSQQWRLSSVTFRCFAHFAPFTGVNGTEARNYAGIVTLRVDFLGTKQACWFGGRSVGGLIV
jgi:hypothetical protein